MRGSILVVILLFVMVFTVNGQKTWNVYVFLAEECPVCNFMARSLSVISGKYSDEVSFHAVFPMKNSNYKTSQIFKEQYDMLSFETLLDKDQKITKQLGATITPEVVITDEAGEIYYRGRVNSAYYAPGKMKHSEIKNDLDETLKLLISGKKVSQPWPPAIGCYITLYASR